MKIKTILWLILIALYAVFHFGFREIGGNHLYRINEQIAFELHPETDLFGGVTVRGYHRTNALVRFMCGACEVDYDEVDMTNAKYIKGDWVYTDYPQHASAKTDIVNLRTGETINVGVPGNPPKIDLSILPEYRERGLVADERYKLKADYVRANFEPLSTFTGWCIWIHIGFGVLAFFLIYPKFLLHIVNALARDDSSDDWAQKLDN
jgi:hypothetical protein